jgi:hypothetical protein
LIRAFLEAPKKKINGRRKYNPEEQQESKKPEGQHFTIIEKTRTILLPKMYKDWF